MATYQGGQGQPEIMDPVDVDEIFPFTIDWTAVLNADGETITGTPVWTVTTGSATVGDGSTAVETAKLGNVTPPDISNTTLLTSASVYAGGSTGTIVVECQIKTTGPHTHTRSGQFAAVNK